MDKQGSHGHSSDHGPHEHHHGHDHHHGPSHYDRAFATGVVLNLGFVGVEAFFGFTSHSVALLADAGHNLSDVLGLLLAWAALWATKQHPSRQWTYGYGRSSILASLVNAVVLLIAVGAIGWEAVQRFSTPEPVAEGTVMWVAAIGIVINAATAAMFMAGSKTDLNIKGAFLHMAADAGVSLGVVIAAFVMGQTGWLWLDPAVSLAIVAVIAVGTWGLLRDSFNLSLDAVPPGIDRDAVEAFLTSQSGVRAVHDLHIWPLSTTSVALTAHLVQPEAIVDDDAMCRLTETLHTRFGIDHATIQIERGDGECRLASDHVV
ncbi:cation diffusion facilitator family transporter [Telmatospirillum sp.]|uniref:cation diffusion facilitator family transporter n=1 Tax=Telmatospirillum sp. TaxID=2079197 RepID=UPI002846F70B|nr:cation diffusion facilitator family transporter [Telmatospirillum sp.]MDR3439149.1 cation diffusion facilitator family transporter [Telmatospirillum sp.]